MDMWDRQMGQRMAVKRVFTREGAPHNPDGNLEEVSRDGQDVGERNLLHVPKIGEDHTDLGAADAQNHGPVPLLIS